MSFANSVIREPLNPSDFARTLLVKRPAFRHEREVRLLFFADRAQASDLGMVRYVVDPHAMVDQMMTDPRLTRRDAAEFVSTIRQKNGIQRANSALVALRRTGRSKLSRQPGVVRMACNSDDELARRAASSIIAAGRPVARGTPHSHWLTVG